MAEIKRVLFLCTGNSARSQMAEALLRHIGGAQFDVFSAGTSPRASVHRLAIDTLRRNHVPTDGLRPKALSTFAGLLRTSSCTSPPSRFECAADGVRSKVADGSAT